MFIFIVLVDFVVFFV